MTRLAMLRDALGWGLLLWLFGYALGIVFFAFVPPAYIGWAITPFGVIVTLWVLLTRVSAETCRDFAILAITWTLIAVCLDYLLIVKLFAPSDGYYKADVYLYYALTLILPLLVGAWRRRARG